MNTDNKSNEDGSQAEDEKNRIKPASAQGLILTGTIVFVVIAMAIAVAGFVANDISIGLEGLLSAIFVFDKKENAIYLFTYFLVFLYIGVFIASLLYKEHLIEMHRSKYDEYTERHKKHNIPRIFSVWILPIISILLVLVSQVVVLPTTDVSGFNLYSLAFVVSTAFVLLMIGMELAYSAQEHQEGHRWLVLVTVSLILDFVSYTLLISGFGAPNLQTVQENGLSGWKTLYSFLLGVASLGSSYFTITQARVFDEVLATRSRRQKQRDNETAEE